MRNNRLYADFWVGEEFFLIPEKDFFYQDCWFIDEKESHLALNGRWIQKYVRDLIGRVSDFYTAIIVESRNSKRLGKPIVVITD